MKKYIVIAGKVRSKNDKDLHRVSSKDLCRLYGVNPKDCVFADEDRPETLRCIKLSDFIILQPRFDGEYPF